MGASGWQYFVPYQSDFKKALDELREQVFQSGKYYKRTSFLQSIIDESYYDAIADAKKRQEFIEWHRTMKAAKEPEPTTIEELIMLNEEDGTHSIIDITGISSTPKFGMATPLSSLQLIDFFGSEKPTRDLVKQKVVEIMDLRERWQATYIIVYKDGLPDEIFFTGFSGD